MSPCDWCVMGKCRSEDEKTCDFRTLQYEKDAIKQRIGQEMDIIETGLQRMKGIDDIRLIGSAVKDMGDRLMGIKVMQQALIALGGSPYKSERNPFRMAVLVKQVDKHMKNLAKEAKQDGGH